MRGLVDDAVREEKSGLRGRDKEERRGKEKENWKSDATKGRREEEVPFKRASARERVRRTVMHIPE